MENEFEFGCITPTSPSSDPTKSISPADQFFLNGLLLPHSFPVQSSKSATSRASSIGSSLMSSRSNSTSSSMSGTTSCSSARTSASDACERKAFQKKLAREKLYGSYGSPAASASAGSQRWQFISPAPVLAPGVSKRRRLRTPKKKDVEGEELGFCKRLLRSFVMSCRACHAMEVDEFGSSFELK